jgi:hypothetical protein
MALPCAEFRKQAGNEKRFNRAVPIAPDFIPPSPHGRAVVISTNPPRTTVTAFVFSMQQKNQEQQN